MRSGNGNKRTIYFISDGTGITAETLGRSVMSQFEDIIFTFQTLPYIDSVEKALEVQKIIEHVDDEHLTQPIVFATLVNQEVRSVLSKTKSLFIDIFNTFIKPIELELGQSSTDMIGKTHSLDCDDTYHHRIAAVDYTLQTDDGLNTKQYEHADVILIGVSRSGKTPTCLYLALQFGIRAANYPITEDDLVHHRMPDVLLEHKNKLFGLTIDASRLENIRQQRRPNSRYASLKQCQSELRQVSRLLHAHGVAALNTTTLSVEEISTRIISEQGLRRRQ